MVAKGALRVDPDRVSKVIDSFREGDPIEIKFADASANYGVKTITNKVVACHKRVTGRFLTLYNEKAYGTEYLVMENWDPMQLDDVVWCIPVPVIVNAKHIGKKPKKVSSDVGQTYLGGAALAPIRVKGGIGGKTDG